ncbi:MAG: hypothetical protein HFG00_05720 [Oscillibacter sp.]|nr:hypothetical protein [Oscillibacter sp.]
MKKLLALVLTLIVLVSAGIPVCASTSNDPLGDYLYREEDYGGLAPPRRNPSAPGRPAEEEDHGGVAPTDPSASKTGRPAGEGDYGGVAPTDPSASKPSYPAGEEDYGGLAPTGPSASQNGRPAGENDYGGIAPKDPSASQNSRPAGEGDYGGLAPKDPSASQNGRPAGEGDYGGVAPKDRDTAFRDPAAEGIVLAGTRLYTTEHLAYAHDSSGSSLPLFHPERAVTRAEAAQMLFRLLPPGASIPPLGTYEDVPAGAWYTEAVRTLAAMNVLEVRDGQVNPEGTVSRGEFIRYIAAFYPLWTDAELFPDVPAEHPNAPFIRSARAYGWAKGDHDGLFHPDEIINRAAAVAFLNRALGRKADPAYISKTQPASYLDVSPDSWYYYDVLEATISHSHSPQASGELWTGHAAGNGTFSQGFCLVDGWQYYYDSARGDVVRSGQVGSFTYDAAGHFTTGSAELDGKLRKIVLAQTNSSMTQEEMLRALYLYTRDSFTYFRGDPHAFGAKDFMMEDALRMLNTGFGDCYGYAALYWYLCRWIGYDAVIYSGTVGSNRLPHSWVEINLDGRNYIFDTELEMAYRRQKRFDINLYQFYDGADSWMYRRPAQ